jgi:cytochrome c oxidase subunit 2
MKPIATPTNVGRAAPPKAVRSATRLGALAVAITAVVSSTATAQPAGSGAQPGPDAGSGSAAPAKQPAAPTVVEVDCAKAEKGIDGSKIVATITTAADAKEYTPKNAAIQVYDIVKFVMSPGYDVAPDEDLGLAVADGGTRCLQFTKPGDWKFHTTRTVEPAPAAGSAGSAAPPAEPKPLAGSVTVAKPQVMEVDCAKAQALPNGAGGHGPIATITSNGSSFTPALQRVTVNDVVKFQMPAGANVLPNTTLSDAGLRVAAGRTVCLQFNGPGPGAGGEFKFHSEPAGYQGSIYAKYWFDLLAERPIQEYNNFWLPKAVNLAADESDTMYIAVLALSIFFFFAIAACVVYFVWKYRHRPGHKAQPSPAHNDALEITWTVIPTIICVFLFYYGWRTYIHVVTPPTKAVEINVQAWRWNWEFKHANGVTDSDLHVPVNTPVRLVMTSRDVLHSFYAPVMRVKQDIIPRRYTYAWFFPTKPGTYRLTCAEYCGTNHSRMAHTEAIPPDLPDGRFAVVVVHEPGGYEKYLADKQASQMSMPPKDLGRMLYEKKGCVQCHTIDGTPRVGPTFLQKDWGKNILMNDGSQVKMDENYVRESLMAPQAKARPGYPPTMPSFEGQLKDKEIDGIIAFLKSLKE